MTVRKKKEPSHPKHGLSDSSLLSDARLLFLSRHWLWGSSLSARRGVSVDMLIPLASARSPRKRGADWFNMKSPGELDEAVELVANKISRTCAADALLNASEKEFLIWCLGYASRHMDKDFEGDRCYQLRRRINDLWPKVAELVSL